MDQMRAPKQCLHLLKDCSRRGPKENSESRSDDRSFARRELGGQAGAGCGRSEWGCNDCLPALCLYSAMHPVSAVTLQCVRRSRCEPVLGPGPKALTFRRTDPMNATVDGGLLGKSTRRGVFQTKAIRGAS